ncbi:phage tail sheath C-terminal domain-containing protein [Clostridium autoethanogenum]|uniref:Tail sheath protein C-terminal domain-containing protein n=1 Tax=Clostridium autoethanogenum DSM 10061 TaxID=1341692 RepID=A0ABN4BJN9_9CLOT|nr:phage tail sheath C-terminal domain-containing protein [Clostridium autoethanogenum]AGY77988.1 hypothetical protein CAETHG_3787 [Clostridium autoethanogenum DSM 10061]ALU38122.1 Hypothetical protein CLAU_3695 [Clostridium autoethanogenum DSM 10061]OVY50886.1 Phage tail sheath protein [Clostridium autoethanogenum]
MAITKPVIDIQFKVLANTFVERSSNKKVILIIKDDTNKAFSKKIYTQLSDVIADNALYTIDNLNALKDCFKKNINQLTVIRIDDDGAIADALAIAGSCETQSYIGVYSSTAADHTALSAWIKTQEASKKYYNAICYNLTTSADSRHVINFINSKVKFLDSTRGEVTGDKYIPSLLSSIAGRNVETDGVTYDIMDDLESVTEVADVDTATTNGQLVLFNDGDKVRILVGINNKTTVGTDEIEDMKLIEYSEAMDMIYYDVYNTYKDFYLSKFKNSNDNREIFVDAVNTYYGDLEDLDILNPDFDNICTQNVGTMRNYLKQNTSLIVDNMTDAQVKQQNFRRNIFTSSNLEILESMTNLSMENILN